MSASMVINAAHVGSGFSCIRVKVAVFEFWSQVESSWNAQNPDGS